MLSSYMSCIHKLKPRDLGDGLRAEKRVLEGKDIAEESLFPPQCRISRFILDSI